MQVTRDYTKDSCTKDSIRAILKNSVLFTAALAFFVVSDLVPVVAESVRSTFAVSAESMTTRSNSESSATAPGDKCGSPDA